MQIFVEKNGKKAVSHAFYLKILVFLGLIAVFGLAMYPIQLALSKVMVNIRTSFIEKLEENLGLEIRYSSIRPAFLGTFEIRHLSFEKEQKTLLSVSRAKFYFSIKDLFLDKKVTIHTVQIDRPSLYIDMNTDREIWSKIIADFTVSEPENKKSILEVIADFLPENIDYKINNLYISYSENDFKIQIENMNMDIKEEASDILYYFNFHTEIVNAGIFNSTVIFKSNVSITGISSGDLKESSADILFSSLYCSSMDTKQRASSYFTLISKNTDDINELFYIRALPLNFTYRDGIMNVFTLSDNTLSTFFTSINTQTKDVFTEINSVDFILKNYIIPSDNLKNIEHLLEIPLNGFFKFIKNDNELIYTADFNGKNPKVGDSFVINIQGDKSQIFVNNLSINASPATAQAGLFEGSIILKGNMRFDTFSANGVLSLENLSFTGKEYVNAILNVSNYNDEIRIVSDYLKIGSSAFKYLDIGFYLLENDIGTNISAYCDDVGAIFLDGVMNSKLSQIESSVMISSLSLYNIVELLSPFINITLLPQFTHSFLRNVYLDTEIFFSSDFINMAFNAPNIRLRNDFPIALISVSGTHHNINISQGIFYINDEELIISASADFSRVNDLDFKINANYLFLTWDIEGQILDRTTLIIRDPNGLHAYGNISNTGSLSGYIEGINFPFPSGMYPVYLDFYAAIRFTSPDFWSLDISHFNARDINSSAQDDFFKISGVADQDGASFRNIVYSDDIGHLLGSADFTWDSDFSYLQFVINLTDANLVGENYYMEGMFANNHITVNASITDIHLNRFIKNSGSMIATGEASLSWYSINDFNVNLKIVSFHANTQQGVVQASFDMNVDNDELSVENLKLDYAGIRTVFPVLHINRLEGFAKTNADIQGFGLRRTVAGKIDLDINFAQIDSWLNLAKISENFNGTLGLYDITFGDLTRQSMVFVFSSNNNAVSVSGGIKNMLRLEMDNDGNFYLGLSDPMPIRGSISGIYRNRYIDAHCGNFYIDIKSLWSLVPPNNSFSINGGYITGKADIRGPIFNPEFFGSGMGSSLSFSAPDFINNEIRPVPFNFIAQGYEMTFNTVQVACGSGIGNTSGWLRFEYWTPKNIGLYIDVPIENPIPYKLNITGFVADGDASGKMDMNFDFDTMIVELKGDLFTNKTEMSLNMDDVFAAWDPNRITDSYIDYLIDIKVTAGPMTEFFWPSVNSPILRINPQMGTVFNVSNDTQAGQYSLVGDVNIRSGELYYFERNFYIRQGLLTFREDETKFDPIINARAETRDRSDTGPVTISMIIENQPLFSFEPRFEASPAMTQLEIYSLLGQNIYIAGSENSDVAQRFLLTSTTDIAAQLLGNSITLLRPVERQIRNFFNLDMFSIRTRFLQNVVVSGAEGIGFIPVDGDNRIGNYFDNTTVFIGKYIGQDMFVQGTLTMKYNENSLLFGGLTLEPDIGIELQSPFLNIRWDFFPNHPENWWVNDNSITLIWSKSF